MNAKGLLHHLERIVHEHMHSLTSCARALGRSHPWLRRKIHGQRAITVGELYDILGVLDMSPPEFFHAYALEHLPILPAAKSATELLQLVRGQSKIQIPRQLPEILEKRVPRLYKLPGNDLPIRVRHVDAISEPAEARAQALDGLQAVRCRDHRGNFCSVLGALASVERRAANPVGAAWILEQALDLAHRHRQSAFHADLLIRAAEVLHDLKATLHGLQLAQQAHSTLLLVGVPQDIERSLLTIAALAAAQGENDIALRAARLCESSGFLGHRVTAWRSLAKAHRAQGDSATALRYLERAIEADGLGVGDNLCMRWLYGQILGDIDPAKAQAWFLTLFPEALTHLDPRSLVLFFFDTVDAYCAVDDLAMLRRYSASLGSRLEPLKKYPEALSIAMNMIQHVRGFQPLSREEVRSARTAFEEAIPRLPFASITLVDKATLPGVA